MITRHNLVIALGAGALALIELAVAGGAQFVVTRNLRHVARMELKFPGLEVVNPVTLMKELSR